MFRRLTVLCGTVLALLLTLAPAALAQPPTNGKIPQGFPPDLVKYVGDTNEFRQGPWFSTPECKDKGGDLSLYLNEVMKVESRLLYWATKPSERAKFWPDQNTADVNREPPELPATFPAVFGPDHSFNVAFRYCADEIRDWTSPVRNTWGLTWAAKPDAESLERMKPYAAGDSNLVKNFSDPCSDAVSSYCQKAFFVDCGRVVMVPDKKERCIRWNESIANFFHGLSQFIADNTDWLERIGQFFKIVGEAHLAAGRMQIDAFASILSVVVDIAKFVANPAGAMDELANSLHASAVDFTVRVLLEGLATVGNFDPSSPWFLATYGASTGLGLTVMALMSVLMISRAASGGGGREELQEALFKQLPLGLFLAVFAPAIATVLHTTVRKMTSGIAAWQSDYIGSAITKLAALSQVTAVMIPGGAGVGSIVFGLLIFGTGAVFVGFALQSVALPLSGLVAGIAWGMRVHPKWRPKAARPVYTYLGLLLSKPLLYFLLGAVFAIIDGNLSIPAMKAGGMPLLSQIVVVIVALIVVGFAPFALLKYAPLLPTAEDSHDSQPSAGFGTAAVVGASMGAFERHQHSRSASEDKDGKSGQSTGTGHSIAQSYSAGQTPQARQQPSSKPQASAGQSGGSAGTKPGTSGFPQMKGSLTDQGSTAGPGGVTPGAGKPGAATGLGGKAPAGTTAQASQAGSAAGGAMGPIGIAAQAALAAGNKMRQGAHRAVKADEETVRGDDK
ncbi:hypothetical protein [Lentzea flaviverrucosa]|uniref:TrbL/VirB6 plasmid conjugal transfer protein n=1 Tax=Lentzea flaviverrucosa TaxID=200379 RepID=A0A1H9ES76_9PSEU|nr:hypothetical protein [Lentzea flaviverrucosa]RDI35419.1 hypothetical protein DFR72_1011170 [Lentzea flaviverrucosa]SEQ28053.1 hypothetical protein SAMN05216195_10247 [Lentzea flaviverrucosa]